MSETSSGHIRSKSSPQTYIPKKKFSVEDSDPPPPTYLPPPSYIPTPPSAVIPANDISSLNFKGKSIKLQFEINIQQIVDKTNTINNKKNIIVEWKLGSKKKGVTKPAQVVNNIAKWESASITFLCKFLVQKHQLCSKFLNLKIKEDKKILAKYDLNLSDHSLDDGTVQQTLDLKSGKLKLMYTISSVLQWVDDQMVLGTVNTNEVDIKNTYLYIYGNKAYKTIPSTIDTSSENEAPQECPSSPEKSQTVERKQHHNNNTDLKQLLADKEEQLQQKEVIIQECIKEIALLQSQNKLLKDRNELFIKSSKRRSSSQRNEMKLKASSKESESPKKKLSYPNDVVDLDARIYDLEEKITKAHEKWHKKE